MALLLIPFPLHSQTPSSSFESANKLYYENKFPEAAAAYEKLIQAGSVSPALYFNLGNAWFKAGQIGRSLAAYRQAEQLAPRDPDIRANLQFARNQTQGPTFSPNRWHLSLAKLTLNEWTMLASGAVWLWFLLLAAAQWRSAWKRNFRKLWASLGVVAAALCACLGAALHDQRSSLVAIVIAPDAVVRRGPLDDSQNVFAVHDGAEMRVLDRKDDWLQVTTDPRRIGWIRRNQVLLD